MVGYFNVSGPEVGYFYSKNCMELTFGTTLQNCKPQMPNFGQIFKNSQQQNWM